MSSSPCRFTPVRPRIWRGRYARVPGDTTAIHVRLINGEWWPVIDWARDDETAHCRMVDAAAAPALAEAVNAGKRTLGAPAGGAFLVNESGQVLVPANDRKGTRVAIVGEWAGPFAFYNPFGPEVFDLADTSNLKTGDPWRRPYIGIPHNLSGSGALYFKVIDDSGITYAKPPHQDAALIAALRSLRPYGAVRFLVGVGGVVLTKTEPAWQPRYVGRIDPSQWFEKEA